MKRLMTAALAVLLLTVCISLSACTRFDESRADGAFEAFVKAVLDKNEATLISLTHPSYRQDIEYGDAFYADLERYGILPGEPVDGIEAKEKKAAKDGELGGNLIVCSYVVMIDQLPYDAVVYILDNDSGYGIIGAEFSYCTDPDYYTIS
ncbi:MAG: hypothetical protein J5793_01955 [Clostridia bacterium]|nr:hypothetical protein [Clostridia bacterium]